MLCASRIIDTVPILIVIEGIIPTRMHCKGTAPDYRTMISRHPCEVRAGAGGATTHHCDSGDQLVIASLPDAPDLWATK
jgi:hypothetical protein